MRTTSHRPPRRFFAILLLVTCVAMAGASQPASAGKFTQRLKALFRKTAPPKPKSPKPAGKDPLKLKEVPALSPRDLHFLNPPAPRFDFNKIDRGIIDVPRPVGAVHGVSQAAAGARPDPRVVAQPQWNAPMVERSGGVPRSGQMDPRPNVQGSPQLAASASKGQPFGPPSQSPPPVPRRVPQARPVVTGREQINVPRAEVTGPPKLPRIFELPKGPLPRGVPSKELVRREQELFRTPEPVTGVGMVKNADPLPRDATPQEKRVWAANMREVDGIPPILTPDVPLRAAQARDQAVLNKLAAKRAGEAMPDKILAGLAKPVLKESSVGRQAMAVSDAGRLTNMYSAMLQRTAQGEALGGPLGKMIATRKAGAEFVRPKPPDTSASPAF